MSILKIRDKDGNIQEILTLKGEKGDTPVKGKDYFTEADKTEMVNEVLAALPNADEVSY